MKSLFKIAPGIAVALTCTTALAQSATPPPGLPDPANSPTAGDQYRGRNAEPSPGRRSATPPPGLPDPANSPMAEPRSDDRRNNPPRYGAPVFGRPGERPGDAPFAPQADERHAPPARYYGGEETRKRGNFAEPDFAIDRRGER